MNDTIDTTPVLINSVANMLVKHEGLRLKPYRCTAGRLTIGVGRNLDDNGISENEAMYLLRNDILRVVNEARKVIDNFDSLSLPRQAVVVDMIFNLGIAGFSKFKKTIEHIEKEEFSLAASEMLVSNWAKQVGKRALVLSRLMENG